MSSAMADLDHVITVRLLSAIDEREFAERSAAKRVRRERTFADYAFLLDAAAMFWQRLGFAVEARAALSRDQATALAWLREPIKQDVLGLKRKHTTRATHMSVTTSGAAT